MLDIKDFHVFAGNKEIVKGLSLKFKKGKIHALMGPNGSGKSSFCNALMGNPELRTKGSMRLGAIELSSLPSHERARKGIFLAFQAPEELEGIKVGSLVRKILCSGDCADCDVGLMLKAQDELLNNAAKLGIEKEAVKRDLNVGFSGGERKKLETLQLLALKPKLIMLDEIDSGLDVDGIKLIAGLISKLNDGSRTFIIITHYPRILRYIKPDFVHVMVDGRIVRSGDAKLAAEVERKGYSRYMKRGKHVGRGKNKA